MTVSRVRKTAQYPYGKESCNTLMGVQEVFSQGVLLQTTPLYERNWTHFPFIEAECHDEVHKRRRGRWDSGGPLRIVRAQQHVSLINDIVSVVPDASGRPRYRYSGSFIPVWSQTSGPLPSDFPRPIDSFDFSNYGAEAWNKFKPVRPDLDLANFIFEMRDFPKLFQMRARQFKDLGGAYLNQEFGWKPFLGDLMTLFKSCQTIQKRVLDIQRLNNKWHLRKGPVATGGDEVGNWDVVGGSFPFYPVPVSTLMVPSSHRSTGRNFTRSEVWFSGRFRYYIPHNAGLFDGDNFGYLRRRLLGLRLSPEVVWNAIPWSWLIDWCSNMGDVVSNMSDMDINLSAKYAYVMGYTTHTAEQLSTAEVKPSIKLFGSIRRENTYKQRVAANPFGFGLSDGDLSIRQWAILAALGLTRLPRLR